ncbi:MAG TPA: hypothetical protein VK171_17345, partial [Fimbriimonas sp.]|nr:hypothetical protein [Fimbriimonas sp.]
ATTMLGLWIILGLILAVIVFKWGRLATQLIILDGEGRFSARPKVVALGLSVPVINALTCPLALAWLMRAGSASRNISQAEIIGRISLLGFLTVALLGWGFNYLSGPRMQLMLSAGFSTSMMVALEHVSLYAAMAGAWILTRKVIEDAKVRVDQMPQKAENSQADE